jgi:RNA polymerase sigma factor (sigma-70 family)
MSRRTPRPPSGSSPLADPRPADGDPAPADAVAASRQLLEDSHDLVVEAVRYVAARQRLSRDVTDELRGRVMLHLASHDYLALRRWRRESSLQTYLVTVITNVFFDYRNHEWGKAKPPAIARRRGAEALLLWRLTHRKRLSFDEAVSLMQTEYETTATRDELWTIYCQFPRARGRYFVDVNELADREQPGAEADGLVVQRDLDSRAARVERALAAVLRGLEAEDRLILKLFFNDGMTRAAIARLLRLDQQRLYPRFLLLLERLRVALEAEGIDAAEARDLVGGASAVAADTLRDASKSDGPGPSLPTDGASGARRRTRIP